LLVHTEFGGVVQLTPAQGSVVQAPLKHATGQGVSMKG
jgi:hypothetical protein